MNPSFYITTLGCPKNTADSREMQKSLLQEGFAQADSIESADFHLINSCAFIQSAREETIRAVFEAADIKKTASDQKLILVGCFSERYETAVTAEMPEVDLSFGTGMYHRAGRLLKDRFQVRTAKRSTESVLNKLARIASEPYAPVKLSEGCDRTCAFCAIPQFRGSFRERPAEQILQESRELAMAGVSEICLVSQDTNRYGGSAEGFFSLIEQIADIPDIQWIRPLYLYPDRQTERLLKRWKAGTTEKLVPYLESPVQHASDRILSKMNRAGSYDFYKDLFAFARTIDPDFEIRTSLLLGFPGETSQDVDQVIRFIEEVKPEKLALFGYSPEEGTSAALGEASTLNEKEISHRINIVREAHLSVVRDCHDERIGKMYRCMVDLIQVDGVVVRRPQDAPEVDEIVHIDSTNGSGLKVGQLVNVEITGAYEYDMSGILVQ